MAQNTNIPFRPNRKNLARQERERIQRQYIYIGTGIVVGLVVVLLLYGIIAEGIVKPRQPVASVNGQNITTQAFEARVRYERIGLVNQWYNTFNTMSQFGGDPSTTSFFTNSLSQIEFELDPVPMGREILNLMVEDELIRQEAEKRGITVTEDEITEGVQEFFGYFPDGPRPTNTPFPTPLPSPTLTAEQIALLNPTPTPVITETETLTVTEEAPTPVPTTEPVAQPTATPYTEEAFQEDFDAALTNLEDQINFTEADLRALVEVQLYRQKMQEEISKDVVLTQEQVWARHILVADVETANDLVAQLNAGADFAQLAQEFSTDTGSGFNGGDLGWFTRGRMVMEFEEAAFSLGVGEISEPVESQFGFHIIQVLGKEDRPIGEVEYSQLAQSRFAEWLEEARTASDIELFEIWTERVPSDPALPPNAQGLIQDYIQSVSVPTPQADAPADVPAEETP